MKKLLILLTLVLSSSFIGCNNKDMNSETEYNAIVISQNKNIVTIHSANTRNDDKKWTQLDLYDEVRENYIKESSKMQFKVGDLISFKAKGFGGWSDVHDIKVVSHDNPIPNNN